MATPFYPLAGALKNAQERQTVYAASIMKLFQSDFSPSPSNPVADYDDAEADYDNYASITMTTWNNPILAPGTGYMIESPYCQFEVGLTPPLATNEIGGLYIVDSDGDLRIAVVFDAPVPMQIAGQGLPLQVVDLFPTGA